VTSDNRVGVRDDVDVRPTSCRSLQLDATTSRVYVRSRRKIEEEKKASRRGTKKTKSPPSWVFAAWQRRCIKRRSLRELDNRRQQGQKKVRIVHLLEYHLLVLAQLQARLLLLEGRQLSLLVRRQGLKTHTPGSKV
ncbi:unnamed protein product, partial [Ectocarpus fasciculatus]